MYFLQRIILVYIPNGQNSIFVTIFLQYVWPMLCFMGASLINSLLLLASLKDCIPNITYVRKQKYKQTTFQL